MGNSPVRKVVTCALLISIMVIQGAPPPREDSEELSRNQVITTAPSREPAIPLEVGKPENAVHQKIFSFYAHPDLQDGFGSRIARVRPHTGLDFPHPGGTEIPALTGGVVTISEWTSDLGWIVEVRQDDGRFVGYRHLLTKGLSKGSRVEESDTIGVVGNTGSSSRGNHLCTTNSTTSGGVYGIGVEEDPWPHIQQYIKNSER